MNEKMIFNRRIAIELRKQGFKLIKTIPNHNNPKYDVYIFDDGDEINRRWNEIIEKINKYKS